MTDEPATGPMTVEQLVLFLEEHLDIDVNVSNPEDMLGLPDKRKIRVKVRLNLKNPTTQKWKTISESEQEI